MESQQEADAEFAAMQSVYSALLGLNEDARERVLDYVSSRLDIVPKAKAVHSPQRAASDLGDDDQSEEADAEASGSFGSFAELYDASQPKSQPEKALAGGYWLQVCQGGESFDGFSVNKELKNLGEGVANITSALDALKTQKPALCLQLKKAGKSRQARKTYKLTVAGIKAVEAMIGG
jgi:hypothetical protein